MTNWVAGWNMPGCLPESDPVEFDTWVEARDYLRDELDHVLKNDDGYSTNVSQRARFALRELDPADFDGMLTWSAKEEDSWSSANIGGYVYWIMRNGA
jgi:hypothetical protein